MEITKETIIFDIISKYPETMPAFQEIGMHCMGCALATGESLEQACAVHGVDPDEFVATLEAIIA